MRRRRQALAVALVAVCTLNVAADEPTRRVGPQRLPQTNIQVAQEGFPQVANRGTQPPALPRRLGAGTANAHAERDGSTRLGATASNQPSQPEQIALPTQIAQAEPVEVIDLLALPMVNGATPATETVSPSESTAEDAKVAPHPIREPDVIPGATAEEKLNHNQASQQVAAPPVWQVYISSPPAPPAPPAPPLTIVNVPPAPVVEKEEPVVDPREVHRQQVAAEVSESILGQPFRGMSADQLQPLSESLTAVQMLRQAQRLQREAEQLIARGAHYAARQTAAESLRAFAAASDLAQNSHNAKQQLDAALEAVRESGDFLGRYGTVDQAGLARMVGSHRTPLLKRIDTSDLSPVAAADLYLDFARDRFSRALAGNPDAARSLMVLGQAERQRDAGPTTANDSIALCCARAALAVSPEDATTHNELGYLALQVGLLDEARWALERGLSIRPSTEALQNLVETHRLAGNIETAQMLARQLPTNAGAPQLNVLHVSPEAFASISPPVQNGSAAAPTAMGRGPVVPQPTLQPPANQDNTQSVMQRVAGAVRNVFN